MIINMIPVMVTTAGTLRINDRKIIQDSYIQLSDKPGPGLELNIVVAMKYLLEGETWWG